MEIQIILQQEDAKQGIIHLKDFIDRNGIDGLEGTEIERSSHGAGQMGAGEILNSITALIRAAEKPLVELVKCLQKFVENYRTTIVIPTKKGNIVLNHGRSMTPEQLESIVTAIQKNDS